MDRNKSCIDFNHLSCNLREGEIEKLKRWYAFYHKQHTCYKWKHKRLKKVKLALNMTSGALVIVGGLTSGLTANPIILAAVSGPGILIQCYVQKSNLSEKVQMCKFASSSYKKVLTQLRSYLRGLPYDEGTFLSDIKVVDDIVTDLCPPVNGMSKRYHKIYNDDGYEICTTV